MIANRIVITNNNVQFQIFQGKIKFYKKKLIIILTFITTKNKQYYQKTFHFTHYYIINVVNVLNIFSKRFIKIISTIFIYFTPFFKYNL